MRFWPQSPRTDLAGKNNKLVARVYYYENVKAKRLLFCKQDNFLVSRIRSLYKVLAKGRSRGNLQLVQNFGNIFPWRIVIFFGGSFKKNMNAMVICQTQNTNLNCVIANSSLLTFWQNLSCGEREHDCRVAGLSTQRLSMLDGPLLFWVNLPVVDTIHPQGNKFV